MCGYNLRRGMPPMQKNYLLLRNNQQSGPFNIEELAGMSLQAKDLIWIIGQSAGWRYPEEIDDLRGLMWDKNAAQASSIPVATPKQEMPSAPAHAVPVDRISNEPIRHIYVSLPAKPVSNISSNSTESATSLSFEERVEKMRQRVATVDTSKVADETPEVDVKYSRSLDDIKEEYASWMHTQKRKQKTGFGIKQAGVIAVVVIAGVLGSFWVTTYLNSPSSEQALLVNTTNVPLVKKTYPVAVQPIPALRQTSSTANKPQVRRSENVNRSKQDKVIDSASVKQPDSIVSTEAEAGEAQDSSLAIVNETPQTANKDSQEADTEKPTTVVDQLQLQASFLATPQRQKGMGGLAVTIKNNSSQLMKVVAVDVIYYEEGMNEIDRKTLYFSNLQPGQALTHNAPANTKAEGAYAQLGLVSSEKGNIFYASNN